MANLTLASLTLVLSPYLGFGGSFAALETVRAAFDGPVEVAAPGATYQI